MQVIIFVLLCAKYKNDYSEQPLMNVKTIIKAKNRLMNAKNQLRIVTVLNAKDK